MGSEEQPKPLFDEKHRFYNVRETGYVQTNYHPYIRTPLTRLTEDWFSGVNMPCERYERLVMQCAYPGSKERMVEKCWKQIEDFKECVYGLKQKKRYHAIQMERRRQNKYEAPPPGDCFHERRATKHQHRHV